MHKSQVNEGVIPPIACVRGTTTDTREKERWRN